MPKYTIQVPDGRTITAEAPDEATALKGIQDWYKANPKTEAPKEEAPALSAKDTALDTVAAAGSGLTKGTLDLGTMPADMATAGAGLARKLGVSDDTINKIKTVAPYLPGAGQMLTASQALRQFRKSDNPIAKGLKEYTDYQPQSTVGKYAKTVGEFTPGAIGGPEGMALRFAKYALLPGVASERLGQMTEGTAAEPYARMGGALLGLGGGGAGLNRLGERLARSGLEDAQHFQTTGHNAYEAAKRANVLIRNSTIDNLKSGLSQHLDDLGFLPGSETKASAALDRIYQDLSGTNSQVLAGRGAQTGFGQKPIALWELDKVGAKIAKKIKDLSPTDKGDRRILWAAKHYIDDFAQGLGQNDIMAGNLPRGLQALADAKANWSVKSKLELVDQMERNAQDTGHALYTRAGVEHGNRKEFLKYLRKDQNKRQALTPQELNQFERVAQGTHISNAARDFGKLSNSAQTSIFNSGLAGAAGFYLGGPLGLAIGAGLPLASRVARAYSNRATQRAINDARSIIINGRKLRRPYKSVLGTINTLNEARSQ